MTPHIAEPDFTLYLGEALATLAQLPDGSVDCVITSPPYWALRDYGTGEWAGGDTACDHVVRATRRDERAGAELLARGACDRCGAQRLDSQLGLEPVHDCAGWATGVACSECYVCKLVAILAECRRVLAPHGTLWLNLGDTYASNGGAEPLPANAASRPRSAASIAGRPRSARSPAAGLKAKDLVGVPWRVALAAQADGWWLRNDNVWSKGNPMPDSVTDRANVSHEYVFMLARNGRPLYWTHDVTGAWADRKPIGDAWWFPPAMLAHLDPVPGNLLEPPGGDERWRRRNAWTGHPYWYDAEAVKEPVAARTAADPRAAESFPPGEGGGNAAEHGHVGRPLSNGDRRTARTVWTINTEPYPRAHFAVFPQRLARRALRAGCPREVCTVCGLPRERIVKKGKPVLQADTWAPTGAAAYDEAEGGYAPTGGTLKHVVPTVTVGWTDCGHGSYRPGVVLDPFLGSGTVVAVARQEGRHTIGIELNPAYVPFIAERAAAWRTGRPAAAPAVNPDQLSLVE